MLHRLESVYEVHGISVLRAPICRCRSVRGFVCLPLLQYRFLGLVEVKDVTQHHYRTDLTTVLREIYRPVTTLMESSCPSLSYRIPIDAQHIKHCALTPAVSSLEAYSTPAR